MQMHEVQSALLTTAFHNIISAPTIEAGYDHFRSISGIAATFQEFCDAVVDCLREGLIHEPIRLPEGALQCHWHLELTPDGIEIARSIVRTGSHPSPVSSERRPDTAGNGLARASGHEDVE